MLILNKNTLIYSLFILIMNQKVFKKKHLEHLIQD